METQLKDVKYEKSLCICEIIFVKPKIHDLQKKITELKTRELKLKSQATIKGEIEPKRSGPRTSKVKKNRTGWP